MEPPAIRESGSSCRDRHRTHIVALSCEKATHTCDFRTGCYRTTQAYRPPEAKYARPPRAAQVTDPTSDHLPELGWTELCSKHFRAARILRLAARSMLKLPTGDSAWRPRFDRPTPAVAISPVP